MKISLLVLLMLLVATNNTSLVLYQPNQNATYTEQRLKVHQQIKLIDPITVGVIALAVGLFANAI